MEFDEEAANEMIKKYGIDLFDEMLTENDVKKNLEQHIDKSFRMTRAKIHDHPTKPGVTAKKIAYILPNFQHVDKKLLTVSNLVTENTICKNLLIPGKSKEGLNILSEYLIEDDAEKNDDNKMEEEMSTKRYRFEQNVDYLYNQYDAKKMHKDITECERFIIMLPFHSKVANIRHLDKDVILRRIHKKHVAKYGDEPVEHHVMSLTIGLRLPYRKEAEIKTKKLKRYHETLIHKYRVKDWIDEPKEEVETLDEYVYGEDGRRYKTSPAKMSRAKNFC